MATKTEKQILQEWDELEKAIKTMTVVNSFENQKEQKKRIDGLLNDFEAFCKYYFPNYASKEFDSYQRKFANKIITSEVITAIAHWARDHRKTTTLQMLVIYLAMKEGDVNCLYVSNSYDAAEALLKPIKLQFESNQRIINDFGIQQKFGNWENGHFTISNGCTFRALGRGQKPRGAKEEEIRPNLILFDDLDDDEMVLNKERLDQADKWLWGALFGCFDIGGKKRFLGVGNIIGEDCLIKRAWDKADFRLRIDIFKKVSEKNIDYKLIREYEKALGALPVIEDNEIIIKDYQLALTYLKGGWAPSSAGFTMYECAYMINKMGYFISQREYFNNPITQGSVFKEEWLPWGKVPPMRVFEHLLVAYNDPGWKKTSTSDDKAWVLVGLYKMKYYVIKCYDDNDTINKMIDWGYDIYNFCKRAGVSVRMFMEVVFFQSILFENYQKRGLEYGYPLPVQGDDVPKDNKDARIASMSGIAERGNLIFNEDEKDNHHMQRLRLGLIAFSIGKKTHWKGGADALHGAIRKLEQFASSVFGQIKTGKRERKNSW